MPYVLPEAVELGLTGWRYSADQVHEAYNAGAASRDAFYGTTPIESFRIIETLSSALAACKIYLDIADRKTDALDKARFAMEKVTALQERPRKIK